MNVSSDATLRVPSLSLEGEGQGEGEPQATVLTPTFSPYLGEREHGSRLFEAQPRA